MTAQVLLAQQATPVSWWVLTPTVVILVLFVLTLPMWPWSRGWGWTIAGMSAIATVVVVAFTIAWLFS
jgi:hypothetical protein